MLPWGLCWPTRSLGPEAADDRGQETLGRESVLRGSERFSGHVGYEDEVGALRYLHEDRRTVRSVLADGRARPDHEALGDGIGERVGVALHEEVVADELLRRGRVGQTGNVRDRDRRVAELTTTVTFVSGATFLPAPGVTEITVPAGMLSLVCVAGVAG